MAQVINFYTLLLNDFAQPSSCGGIFHFHFFTKGVKLQSALKTNKLLQPCETYSTVCHVNSTCVHLPV